MDFFKQNKLAVGGLVVALLAVVIYFGFFSGSSGPVLTASNDSSPVSTDLLVALQNLNSIKLDDSIFKDPVFISLTDFGVVIPAQPVGRRNPFLPLSGSTGSKTVTPGGR